MVGWVVVCCGVAPGLNVVGTAVLLGSMLVWHHVGWAALLRQSNYTEGGVKVLQRVLHRHLQGLVARYSTQFGQGCWLARYNGVNTRG